MKILKHITPLKVLTCLIILTTFYYIDFQDSFFFQGYAIGFGITLSIVLLSLDITLYYNLKYKKLMLIETILIGIIVGGLYWVMNC